MENLSHSRHHSNNRSASAKMINNNGGFLAKSLYDEVYGGPPKFGLSSLSPRLEDYSEIFGTFHASRASSIPVLEVPASAAADDDDNDVFFDVRSSGFDYSEVFGGFDGLDFAVAYDDLVKQPPHKAAGDGDSSDEAWTPAESASPSGGSNHSVKNQSISDGDPYYSYEGGTEFSVSYHRAHQESYKDSFNGGTYATPVPVAHGYRYTLDEITPAEQTEFDIPSVQVIGDRKFNAYSNVEMGNEKRLRKTVSHPSTGISAGQEYGDSCKPENGYGRSGSRHKEPFVTISDISLRTQPSHLPPPCRPPPIVDGSSGDSGRLSSNSNTVASDETTCDSSPRFFDVEVDGSSSAAASAAAMKEAMEKARVQLRSAKESMQRKKDSFQSRSKSRSKKEIKEEEGKVGKVVDGSSSKLDDRVQGTFEREEDSRMTFAVSEEKQKVAKKVREVPQSLEDEIFAEAAKNLVQENGKGSWSSQGSFKIDEVSEWQEATQYFDLVAIDDTKKGFEQGNKDKSLAQDTKRHEHRQKEKAAFEALEQLEAGKKVRGVIEVHDLEDPEKKRRELEKCSARSKDAKEVRRWKEHDRKVKATQVTIDKEENEMNSRVGKLPAESEKQRSRSAKSEKHEIVVEVQGKENKFSVENAMQQDKEASIRSDEKHKEFRQREAFESRQVTLEQEENERKLKATLKQAENEKRLKEVREKEENEKRLMEALEKVENEKRLRKALELQEKEKKLKEALELEKKRQKEAAQREENEKRLKEALELEEYQKRQKDAREREENERRLKMAHAREQEYAIKRLNELQEKLETERRLKQTFKQAEAQQKLDEPCVSEDCSRTFKVSEDSEKMEVINNTQKEIERNEIAQELRPVDVTHLHMEVQDHKLSEGTSNHNCSEHSQATQIARNHYKNSETMKEAQELGSHEENEGKKTDNKSSDTPLGPDIVEPVSVSLDLEFKASGLSQEGLKYEEDQLRRKGANRSLPLDASLKEAREENRSKPEVWNTELGKSETTHVPADDKFKVSGLSGSAQGDKESGNGQIRMDDEYEPIPFVNFVKKAVEASIGFEEQQPEFNSSSQKESDHDTQKMECAQEWTESEKKSKQVHASLHQERYLAAGPVKELVDNKRKTEATLSAMAEINNRKSSQQVNASQAPEMKVRNLKEDTLNGEKETERLKRERELENERLRKIEEEREREREREKDRMAVDRATLEARNWATHAEARERAERVAVDRATTDARQRAMAEARERLEKACAEAREKSSAGKAAMEARIKTERAAAERAIEEARVRAAEKLMAERASFQAREQVQRSVSDKFNASSRNNGLRHCSSSSDLHDPQRSRQPYSTAYGERYEGVEGESAQRCKARLERHARTAERAAKALAEKNMRDLLAQREQAERNRFAETLDADVKRWSSGKEGNLRALLSTLQYILGPDSGWQPVPLTEVITAAAVKRAYRKATLCVHPDKLQQRGATIQQKYICEKVFDLLKEAWNKFNSEER